MRRRARPQHVPDASPPAGATSVTSTPPAPVGFCAPIEHHGLRWFRRLFSLVLAYDSWKMARRDEMSDFFAPGRLNFAYWATPSVRPHPELMPHMPTFIGVGAAVAAAGAPRCGLAVATVAQAYLLLCDAARYVNHLYLYVLLSALLLLAAADTPRRADCRAWHLRLLRLQFCIVYFFGGLIKCSHEFLWAGEPLRQYLTAAVAPGRPLHPLRGVLDSEMSVACGAPFAAAYDLLAPLALWWPRLRPWAVGLGLLFHGGNALLFPTIHSFPVVCTLGYALFLVAPRAVPAAPAAPAASAAPAGAARRAASACVAAGWLGVQLLLPLRHHLLSSDVAWTKLGDTFAWRMMADTTDGWVTLRLTPPPLPGAPARELRLHPQSAGAPVTLPQHSIALLLSSPSMLEQYVAAEAAAACAQWRRRGGAGRCAPRVRVEVWKGVNGGPYQRWADPGYDFGRAPAPDLAWASGAWGLGAWRPAWMLPRLRLDAGAAARAAHEVEAWRARGYTVEAFLDAPGRAAFLDRIVASSGHREASLVALHGATSLQRAPPPGGDAAPAEELLAPGEARELHVGREHALSCRGAELCAWLYVMK